MATAPILQPYRLTTAQYERLSAVGILPPDARVELLKGALIEMAPIGGPHIVCVVRLDRLLQNRIGEAAVVSVQNPVDVADGDMPQPDIAMLRPPVETYEQRRPRAADVLLLVEVSDTTLARDRDVKGPLYAANGIPEYWIADLAHGALLVYRKPARGRYHSLQVFRRGDAIHPLAWPEAELAVAAIFGPEQLAPVRAPVV